MIVRMAFWVGTLIHVYKEGIYLTTSEGDVDLCEQVRVPPQYLKEWKLDLSYSIEVL